MKTNILSYVCERLFEYDDVCLLKIIIFVRHDHGGSLGLSRITCMHDHGVHDWLKISMTENNVFAK